MPVISMGFIKHTPEEWRNVVQPHWFTPKVNPSLYRLVRPLHERELWHGNKDELLAAHLPEGVSIPKYHYSVAYALTSRLIRGLKNVSKVLIKPNNTGFIGAFMDDARLREIMRLNGISEYADLQPIATQPAMLAGIVDALLDEGVDEIHIGENMLWAGGTPRAFWETGYVQVFSADRYRGKVFFVDFYEGDTETIELPIKSVRYDLGFFTKTRPPKALFDEGYDLVIVASIAKMHNCAYYSLLIKNFSVTWNPRKKRWHIHGIPLKLFDRSYASELLKVDIPKEHEYKVFIVRKNRKRYAFITNGLLSTSPLAAYREEGELLAQVDPHHLEGLSLAILTLGIGYLIVRFTGMFATILSELRKRGTKLAGIISGVVGQEGEGPLVYGSRRFGGFAVAGFNFPATEALALDMMVGKGDVGFADLMVSQAKTFCKRYSVDISLMMSDADPPWTLKLAEELTGETANPRKLTLSLLDFEGVSNMRSPSDLRIGPPFKLPNCVYVSPLTWLKMMYLSEDLFKHSMDYVDKGITVPLVPPI